MKKKQQEPWSVVAVQSHGMNRYVNVYGPFSSRLVAESYARHCEEFDGEDCSVEPMSIDKPWILERAK
jgi:hypothetical protein